MDVPRTITPVMPIRVSEPPHYVANVEVQSVNSPTPATPPKVAKKIAIPIESIPSTTTHTSMSPLVAGYFSDGWTAKGIGVTQYDEPQIRRGLKLSFLYPLASFTLTSSGRDISQLKSVIIEFETPSKLAEQLSLEFYYGAELVGSVLLSLYIDKSSSQVRTLTIPVTDMEIRGKWLTDIRLRSNEMGVLHLANIHLLVKR